MVQSIFYPMPAEPVCLVLFMTEKINFFINSCQRTSRFTVRLSDYLPNPVHHSNPASRSLLTLNSRISAFK